MNTFHVLKKPLPFPSLSATQDVLLAFEKINFLVSLQKMLKFSQFLILLKSVKECQSSIIRTSIIRTIRLSGLFSLVPFLWILNSCHLENTKLKTDRLNSFKRLLKQRIIFLLKCDEKFLKQTNMLDNFRVYEYLHKKWTFVKNH